LKHISERADIGEHKEALFAVRIPEKKQSFLAFCETIGNRNITEFNYRFADKAEADIFVGVQLRDGKKEQLAIMTELQDAGIKVIDLSDNELAKLHLRHMVGGHAVLDEKEHLFRFQFPEHPSALLNFLRGLGNWNISLFHYRNHGAAYGRVLVGIQAADSELVSLNEHLTKIGYRYWPETDNPAYSMFLNDNSL
jgi:threonine dehydratase